MMGVAENEPVEGTGLQEITKSVEDRMNELKKAITHFYSEINRVSQDKPRKYAFQITMGTCMDAMNQCYEYIDLVESLKNYTTEEDKIDELSMEALHYQDIIRDIEKYTHKIENPSPPGKKAPDKKPKEILTETNAVGAVSTPANDTKGRSKRTAAFLADRNNAEDPKGNTEIKNVEQNDIPEKDLYNEQQTEKKEEKIIRPLNNVEDAVVVKEEKKDDGPSAQEEIESEKLEITYPEEEDKINLQVITDNGEYDEEEIDDTDIISNGDNVPMITDEDLKGYEDGEEDKKLDDIILINNENEDSKQDLYDYINLPDNLTERNIKTISRNKTNAFKLRLQQKSIEPSMVSSLRFFPFDENDENIRKEYFASRNNIVASPQVCRVSLLMSGYYVEISSYSNWDTASLQRAMENTTYDFVDKEIAILNSIYDHIKYFSYTQKRPTFDEWLQTVRYPDYDILFYALYDVNYQGMNYYTIDCPYCGAENISIGKENKDLVVAVDNNYTDDSLVKLITAKEMNKLDNYSYLPKWANKTIIRKMTKDTKILFEYAVPNLYDYITTLRMAKRIANREKKELDLGMVLENGTDEYARILLYLYVYRVGMPVPIYGDASKPKEPTSYKYIGLTSRSDIIEIVNSLNNDEYVSLFNGEPIKDLMLKRSIYFYLKDSKCENCENIIKYIHLEPRRVFFSRIV
jgi:hypothetical protein